MRRILVVAVALLATACGQSGQQQQAAAPPTSSTEAPPSSQSSVPPTQTSTQTPPSEAPPVVPTTTTEPAPPPQPAPPPPSVQVAGTPCDITEGACIRLSTNESWLISNGAVSYGPVPITSGRPGYETPVGYFPVLHKVRHEVSRDYGNASMPYSVYFTSYGIAFHEGSLYDESHGCIHLSPEAAAMYFDFLHSGQQVQVAA